MAWDTEPLAPPPRTNVDIEQALLGAVLVDNGALDVIADFDPGCLSEALHRQLFRVILKMRGENRIISPLTLKDYVPLQEIAPGLTFPQYLARLAAAACSTIHILDYAKTLRDLAILRGIISVGHTAERSETAFTHPHEAVLDAYADLDAVRMGLFAREQATNSAAGELATSAMDILYAKIRGEKVDQGALTGIKAFDDLFGGFVPGDLVIMAGRPGMGKTTAALSFARAVALNNTALGSGFFSLEMSKRQIGARLVSDQAFDYWSDEKFIISATDIMRAKMSDDQALQLGEASKEADKLALWFDYASPVSIAEIAAKIRMMQTRLKIKFGATLGVVFIDYLNFITASSRYFGNRNNEIGEITQALKALAKELNICIVVLCQLNRDVEKRADKKPMLSDLRDSGNIEQDADSVIFLYREHYYLQQAESTPISTLHEARNKLELIVAKNRIGPTGSVTVFCHVGASAIRNLP